MLDTLWRTLEGRRCVVAMRGRVTTHYWFTTTEEAEQKVRELDADGVNVFYCPSVFDGEAVDRRRAEVNPKTGRHYSGREQANVAAIPALWLDMDVGEDKDYPDANAAWEALAAWVTAQNVLPPTHVVMSGGGLHIYWALEQPAPPAHWLPVAQHLKQACRVGGLSVDPARTADSASLLRPPGTHNYKRSAPRPVTVLADSGKRVDLQQFRARLPMVGPVGVAPVRTGGGEWSVAPDLPPGDAHRIADKCQQMGAVRFHKGAVEEPLWRAALSILWRCEAGETHIHEWSVGDPRYDAKETQDKAEATAGPATCRHFAELNPDGCKGCPHAGTVTSPISLSFHEVLPDTEGGDEATKVPGFTVTAQGVFKEPAGNEGGPLTKIADFPVWIEDARELASAEDKQLRASLVLGWRDVRGKYHRAPLTQVELHDPKAWTTWLAGNNLASFVHGPQMANYISQMHRIRYREKGARVVYDALGWYDHHSLFVVGAEGITEEGVVPVTVDTQDSISTLSSKGSLEEWKRGMARLDHPDYYPQAFGLLVGFAAPLLDLADRNGAVVAFVGRSGFGKSLAAKTGLSIYADPEKIHEYGRSTHNSLGVYLSRHRHVPALVDEVTVMSDRRLCDLIYMAANGADKSALNQKRERKQAATWRTVTSLTSNHSIVDRQQGVIEEAHRRRLIEVPVLTGVSKDMGKELADLMNANHGVAAAPYIQLLIRHKDKLPALFDVVEETVWQWGYADAADRFGSWTCAAALLGGLLAYCAGVLPFNPVPVVKAIATSASENNASIQTPTEQAHEALFELLTRESKRVCVWPQGGLSTADTDNPIARIDRGTLYVLSSELRSCWLDQHIYLRELETWLAHVCPARAGKHRLAPGTPPVQCYKFSLDRLGWDEETFTDG